MSNTIPLMRRREGRKVAVVIFFSLELDFLASRRALFAIYELNFYTYNSYVLYFDNQDQAFLAILLEGFFQFTLYRNPISFTSPGFDQKICLEA